MSCWRRKEEALLKFPFDLCPMGKGGHGGRRRFAASDSIAWITARGAPKPCWREGALPLEGPFSLAAILFIRVTQEIDVLTSGAAKTSGGCSPTAPCSLRLWASIWAVTFAVLFPAAFFIFLSSVRSVASFVPF